MWVSGCVFCLGHGGDKSRVTGGVWELVGADTPTSVLPRETPAEDRTMEEGTDMPEEVMEVTPPPTPVELLSCRANI